MVRLINTVIVVLFVVFENFVFGKECDPHSLRRLPCDKNESCSINKQCECKTGFTRVDKICQNTTKTQPAVLPVSHVTTTISPSARVAESTSSHVVAGVIVPLILIMVVICGIFINRRYRLVNWVRGKISQRTTNYDEVMIGQDFDDDDPPLH